MGVLNVTPDSFSDGGRFGNLDQALAQAHKLIREGADILDIGGESTRPNADPVPEEEELRRVLPVIEQLARSTKVRLSIDTFKPEVAEACLRAGATMVNDITGLRDPRMAEVTARAGAALVLMHMKGTPQTMREEARYADLIGEVKSFLKQRLDLARQSGVREVILDPGIGFAKTAQHSFTLLRRLREFEELGCPILIGPSRKSFLGTLPGMQATEDRLEGTVAAVAIGVLNGASIVRVHDVEQCRKACLVADAVRNS
jgi:dihydropteroate synthase